MLFILNSRVPMILLLEKITVVNSNLITVIAICGHRVVVHRIGTVYRYNRIRISIDCHRRFHWSQAYAHTLFVPFWFLVNIILSSLSIHLVWRDHTIVTRAHVLGTGNNRNHFSSALYICVHSARVFFYTMCFDNDKWTSCT